MAQARVKTECPLVLPNARFGSLVRGAGGDITGGTFRRDPVREIAHFKRLRPGLWPTISLRDRSQLQAWGGGFVPGDGKNSRFCS